MTRETRNSTLRLAARFARMRALFASFRSNTRANVAVISAVSALPLITAIGCVVDYTTASMIRTKLQGAADAATLASVSANSPLMATAKAMTGNGNVSGGSTATVNFFNSNLTGTTGYTTPNPTANVTKTGMVISATLSFTAQVPTFFLGVIGYRNIAISGTSTSSYTLPTYIDFYLMVDVSGSMSFPSTASEQARLQAVNPDNMTGSNGYPKGCTFACHFAAQGACPQSGNPGPGTIPRRRHLNESIAGWILPRIYHYPPGNDAGVLCLRQQLRQRPEGKLDQFTGHLLPQSRHHVLYPVARRRRRLCREPIVVDRQQQRAGDQSIPGRTSTRSSSTSIPTSR